MGYLKRASKALRSKYCSLLSSSSVLGVNQSSGPLRGSCWCPCRGERSFCSHSRHGSKDNSIDLNNYPPERIRNFSIIAHVDHGKSTLADRLLELTGTIRKGHGQPQYLDKLQVERERGITVKAQTATMFHRHGICHPDVATEAAESQNFLLNLIDTPGHVDFSYEVSRSLAACQAQTVANFYLAFESNLTIIPIINKIDQAVADPERVKAQLKSMFDLDPKDVLLTSAKTGQGLEHVLPAVIERIPSPSGKSSSPLRMLLLDSYYDEYKGVICHVAVIDGALRKGDKIESAATGQDYEVLDVGIMHPELTPTGTLLTGQVGYIVTGMRSTKEARIGDTLFHVKSIIEPLPGFKPAKHMVFSGLYPADGSDFDALNHAIERLTCNDASVSVTKESSMALGMGFRCGFLGLLHMDVFHQRLEQEYGAQVISTIPTVPYIFEYSDGSKVHVQNPAQLPSNPGKRVTACWEPSVLATIIIPSEYVGPVITLCSERRGEQLEYSFIDSQRAMFKYRLPLREIVVDYYNELKSVTSGYASFDYEDGGYQASDLVKLDILLNGQPVDAMATIVHNLKAQRIGRDLVEKLKKFIDRQMFEITIQAAIGSKVIARETISAMRKNVLAKCYGGDVTRKKKLLEKQKEGKKRMKRVGSVDLPQEAFHQLLKWSFGMRGFRGIGSAARGGRVLSSGDLGDQRDSCDLGITSIRELVSQGLYTEALYLYARLRSSGYRPNFFTYPSLLKACGKLQSSSDARELHTHIIKTGFLSQLHTCTALTDVYMKLCQLDDALKVFSEIPDRNLASSNSLVAGFAQCGCFWKALHVIRELQGRGLRPNSVTLASVLPACGSTQDGMMLHCFAIKIGCEMDVYVATAVLSMYSKCQDVVSAVKAFLLMPCKKKAASYNALMSGFLLNGLPRTVIDLFKEMREKIVERPSSVTWLSLLSACSDLSALQLGRQIHCFLLKHELEFDAQLGTALVDMYSKCGSPALAYKLFGTLSEKNITTWNCIISGMFLHSQGDIALKLFQQLLELEGMEPDNLTWNAMISGFSRLGDGIKAFNFFNRMQIKGSVDPTLKTVTSILPACSALADLKHGKEVHSYTMRKGFYDDNFVSTAIIDMYMKCGFPYKAQLIFDRVDELSKDVPMWNAMIDGCGRNGESELALAVFDKMLEARVKPNSATFLSIMSACASSGQVEKAQQMFRVMTGEHGLKPSAKHVSCMVDLFGRAGRIGEARELSRKISSPSAASVFASLLGSCKIHSDVELGEEMTKRLFELDPGSATPYVILAGIYAQNGMWAEAERVRQIVTEKGLQKVTGCSWIAES
ncbi:hypothetical protein H6P81_003735 [Aristolochia fimbriata]|uniref:Translation factor GUF1 homolog, mitochondrial n=2 Tax=Magnoliopsida TaxID=3398 RepID=A0AAV7FH95_ARIFI|nr:hypothetical protein H6P81_003735 [Aristolochia fimbriata]